MKGWFQHDFNMNNCSAKVTYNKQRVRGDGTVMLYLRVIIDCQRKDISLKIYWPVDRFDEKKGLCLAREKDCEKHKDVNVIMADAQAKAAEIFVQYRLKRMDLTLPVFLEEYKSNVSRNDFLTYYENRMLERCRLGEINEESVRTQRVTLNHLKAWKGTLLFSQLNNRTAAHFDSYLLRKTKAKSINARWGQHKNFKTYLNQAKKRDNISFVNPYDYFRCKSEMGRFQPLTKDQLIHLYEFYDDPLIHATHRKVLRAFLFGCFTGMRHSDIRRMDLEWMDGEFLDFVPYKTRRYGTRVRVPLTGEAVELLADEMDEGNPAKLFRGFSEQKDNEYINEVGKVCDINMKLCFQIARETFATLYMEHEGKLEVLSAFLGHKTTQMTEKYVKIMDQRKKTEGVRISGFRKRDI